VPNTPPCTRAPEARRDSAAQRSAAQCTHIERLSGEVLHAREHDERELRPGGSDRRVDILLAQTQLAVPRRHLDEGILRVEAVQTNLRLQRVLQRQQQATAGTIVVRGSGQDQRRHARRTPRT
jgi:hypothetical protein